MPINIKIITHLVHANWNELNDVFSYRSDQQMISPSVWVYVHFLSLLW